MGVYIKGFKPTDGLYVIKDRVIRKYKGKGGTVRPYELVEVEEPHGRLIDADEIVKDLRHDVAVDQDMLDYEELTDVIRETTQADKDIKQNAAEIIESLPTVQFEERTKKRTETHACDLIKRQAAIEAAVEAADEWDGGYSRSREEIITLKLRMLPSAQPETCEGCKHLGKWENEVEYGYPSPCTSCKRRVEDHYER